jgi:oligopeptide/dipeptide ABC transporter ATP-binding protein
MKPEPILKVNQLRKYFPVGSGFFRRSLGFIRAVDGVDLTLQKGETLGLVGESGCGKSTLGYCILRLEEPTSGHVMFEGRDILTCSRASLQRLRQNMQIIFQDPYSSLNPRKTVGRIIGEGYVIHGLLSPEERRNKVMELLEIVGLLPEHYHRYPHEFSGGQRQRVCISRALALNPRLVIADEPVSALDVSVQAQILNLLVSLQNRFHLTYLFISHDLGVVRHLCDRIAVMYLGKVVESASSQPLYAAARHPYTASLLSAVPVANPFRKRMRIRLTGDVPSPVNPPSGCRFHPRCPRAQTLCAKEAPALDEREPGRLAACHFPLDKPVSL